MGLMFFQQAGYSLLETLVITFSFLWLGILIEAAFRWASASNLPSPSSWNRIFNCKCTAVLTVFQGSIEVMLFIPVYTLAFKIEALSPGPWIRPRQGVLFAISIALVASIVGDLLYYWFHRLEHTSRWLWPIHELHHEDEHVNVTTAFKFHWIDAAALHAVQVVPAIFLPKPLVTIPLLYFARFARVTFEHLAVPLHLGPFNWLITNPAVHRIHHSTLPEHFNKNFAAVWPFWDVLFGTYSAPRRGVYPPTGVHSGKVTKSLKEAFWSPLEVSPKQDEPI
jgi:sterol desaturase/sphingolipid hydroxylase (fatty acid hydroxylase superfamily)